MNKTAQVLKTGKILGKVRRFQDVLTSEEVAEIPSTALQAMVSDDMLRILEASELTEIELADAAKAYETEVTLRVTALEEKIQELEHKIETHSHGGRRKKKESE